jgi:glycine cleavage system H protein
MNIPEDLKYTEHDEWIRVEGDTALIGITDYAQDQLSDIVYLDVALEVGESKKQDELFGAVESVKAAADMYMPASGEVLAVNEELKAAPETINSDPYGGAWMLKIKLADPAELDKLMDAAAYKKNVEAREG